MSDTFQRDTARAIDKALNWPMTEIQAPETAARAAVGRYLLAMHTIAILALEQVIPFDLSTPIEVFSRTRLPDGRPGYQVRVCAEQPEVDAGLFTVRVPWGLEGLGAADTIIVPGTADPTTPLTPAVRDALRAAAANGTRIASICSGTFPLAATGLLDGLRATTHWIVAELLAATHPDIEVDPDVLYIDNGQILTSAGASAGLDLCLHMIRRDYGSAVAADAARLSVMPLEREGGQAQFIVHDHAASPSGIGARTAAGLAAGQSGLRPHPRRHRRPRRNQHPDPDTPLPRTDRDHAAPVAPPRTHPPGPAPPGDHAAFRRTHRRPGRIRFSHRFPRPVQEDHRRQPTRLPPRLQLITGTRAGAESYRPRTPSTSEVERRGSGDVGELVGVADEVDAGDEAVLDLQGHDAVDLAVDAQEQRRIAVGGGGLAGERAFLVA